MTNTPRYDRIAADLFGRVREPGREPSSAERQAAIAAMEAAIRARTRRQTYVRTMGAMAIAASVAVGIMFVWQGGDSDRRAELVAHAIGGAVTIEDGDGARALSGEAPLRAGSRIISKTDGGATLKLATGTLLSLEPNADLRVIEPSERFALSAGAVRADVAKLAPGRRFVVMTIDTEVEVRGTSFRVAIAEPSPCTEGRTRVDVFEGEVRVRHEGREVALLAGASWPPPCAPVAEIEEPAQPALARPAHLQPAQPVPAASKRVRVAEAPTIVPQLEPGIEPASNETEDPTPNIPAGEPSQLAEQNDLFAEAAALAKNGEVARALARFDALIAEHPDGPLAQAALVQTMRLLRDRDPAEAKRIAARYLRRYPDGFARDEAELITKAP